MIPEGNRERVLRDVRAAFEREPRISMHRYPGKTEFADGVLTLEGEVEHIAAKKLSLKLAVAVHGVSGIVDRLHVVPATHMGEGAILDAVRDALLEDPTLKICSIQLVRKGQVETVRQISIEPHGVIRVSVMDGGSFCSMTTSLVLRRSAWPACWRGGCPAAAM